MDRPVVTVPLLPRPLRVAGAVGVALFILFASVVDPPSTGQPAVILGVPQDKWLHALAYAGLTSALAYATLSPNERLSHGALAVALLLAIGYGVGIEGVQTFLPARAFDPADALANTVGAVAGTVPWLGVRGRG